MLSHLSIRNYTLVDQLDLDLANGMTAITGETGAGKSIMLDALALTLGDRADFSRIRKGQDKAEVNAIFDASENLLAMEWLRDQDLDQDGDCILRRSIQSSGKSSAWINGRPVTLGQLKDLAELLISIHSQHEHQKLVRPAYQAELIDQFGELESLRDQVKAAWQNWQSALQALQSLQASQEVNQARRQELEAIAEDLDRLALQAGEFELLEQEQAELANAEAIIQTLQRLVDLLREDEQFSLDQGIRRAVDLVESLPGRSAQLDEALEMLHTASIQLDEAGSLIRSEADRVELNPERLQQVEDRLSDIFQTARKYRLNQEDLGEFSEATRAELNRLSDPEAALAEAEQTSAQAGKTYLELARKLSAERTKAGAALCDQVNPLFDGLAMKGAAVQYLIKADETKYAGANGIDQIELLVRTNPGQDFGSMAKVASGGELSRISLAIQMVTAKQGQMPCLVFDEVDVGIGGATAERVGSLLRQLAARAQVICITHLAQVAAHAHAQMCVKKEDSEGSMRTAIEPLGKSEREREIARMLRGSEITEAALQNARELLEQSQIG